MAQRTGVIETRIAKRLFAVAFVLALYFSSRACSCGQEVDLPSANEAEVANGAAFAVPTDETTKDSDVPTSKVDETTAKVNVSANKSDESLAKFEVPDEKSENATLDEAGPEAEPDEALLKDWLSAVLDNSLYIQNRELPAYRYLLNKVNHQSYEDLKSNAVVSPPFDYYYKRTDEHRGNPVELDVFIRRINKLDFAESDKFHVKQLYEVWGFNNESKTRLYVFVTPELPPGMSEGEQVNYRSRFAGYFFKLQGYKAATLERGDRLLVSPLLIGKFSENIPLSTPPAQFASWPVFLLIFCLVLVVFFRFTRVASFMGGASSIFPPRLKDDVEKPTDKENLDWIGDNIGQNQEPTDDRNHHLP